MIVVERTKGGERKESEKRISGMGKIEATGQKEKNWLGNFGESNTGLPCLEFGP